MIKSVFASLWLILVTVLLTLPGSAFPKENWLDQLWMDKWIHIFLFAVLVFLWTMAVGKKNPTAYRMRILLIVLGVSGLTYGTGMEFIQQYFVENRSFDGGDILADGAGSLLGCIMGWYRYKKNKPL